MDSAQYKWSQYAIFNFIIIIIIIFVAVVVIINKNNNNILIIIDMIVLLIDRLIDLFILIANAHQEPTWNFWKFLVDSEGKVKDAWGPDVPIHSIYGELLTEALMADPYHYHHAHFDDEFWAGGGVYERIREWTRR